MAKKLKTMVSFPCFSCLQRKPCARILESVTETNLSAEMLIAGGGKAFYCPTYLFDKKKKSYIMNRRVNPQFLLSQLVLRVDVQGKNSEYCGKCQFISSNSCDLYHTPPSKEIEGYFGVVARRCRQCLRDFGRLKSGPSINKEKQ